jgi:hypothetical protein
MGARTRHTRSLHLLRIHVPSVSFEVDRSLLLLLDMRRAVTAQWAEIQGPGLTIGLHPAGPHGPKPGNSESLAIGFTVDNLDNDVTTFKNKGILFSPNITEDGPVRIAFFTDPDKNPLYLCEVRQNNE